jgi:voltage-gated potassium channel Kch
MTNSPREPRHRLRLPMSEFWSGDLGLTLVTISLVVLTFIIPPLREAGVPGRLFFDLLMMGLMIYAALVVNQSRLDTILVIAVMLATGAILGAGRLYPTAFLHELGSVFVTVTLLLFIRIVLLVVFRGGPVTWSRIQGGICIYLLVGLVWASTFQLLEQIRPGSFHFVTLPADVDQFTAKFTYFSFATLTTVGFGDVLPLDPFARSLAIAEAVVGQLFPAIFIGALVALAMQSRSKS